MYKIQPVTSKKTFIPIYKIVFKYMIGDDDGKTTQEVSFDKNCFENENLQKTLSILQKFAKLNIKGWCGPCFVNEAVNDAYEQKLLTEEEYNIIMANISYKWDEKYNDYKYFYSELLYETEYSCLSIENITITYYDENRVKYNVVWED